MTGQSKYFIITDALEGRGRIFDFTSHNESDSLKIIMFYTSEMRGDIGLEKLKEISKARFVSKEKQTC